MSKSISSKQYYAAAMLLFTLFAACKKKDKDSGRRYEITQEQMGTLAPQNRQRSASITPISP